MPYVTIETRGDWLKPRAAELFAAIDAALVRVLKVPPEDSLVRLVCHDPDLVRLPRSADPHFVFVEIALFPGRSLDTKTMLYRELTTALAPLGVAPEALIIALRETGLDNWGIGARPASAVQFSFPIEV